VKYRLYGWREPKVFVIGANKTGTTTLAAALKSFGYHLGDQVVAEVLHHRHSLDGDVGPIVRYCRSANAFQDVPFSAPGTYEVLDRAFPGSRFVLTVRSTPEEWYESYTRFFARVLGTGDRLPTADELRERPHPSPGFYLGLVTLMGTTEAEPFDRATCIDHYTRHNAAVRAYFEHRPGDLLELNVAQPDALDRLSTFLGKTSPLDALPHLNRSR
jgi:hypothetical protein